MKTFEPFMMKSSPSRRAHVFMPCKLLPACGSVMARFSFSNFLSQTSIRYTNTHMYKILHGAHMNDI